MTDDIVEHVDITSGDNQPAFPVVKGYVCDGVHYRLLSNGAVYGKAEGRIVAADVDPATGDYPFSIQDKARQAITLRWERNRAALARGAASALRVAGDEQVVEKIGAAVAQTAVTKGASRQIEAANWLVNRANLLPATGDSTQEGGITVKMGDAAASRLFELIQQAIMARQDGQEG